MCNKLSRLEIARRLRLIVIEFLYETKGIVPCHLEGTCAICSKTLAKLFKDFGYPATAVEGSFDANYINHCWVESENYIYDITISQFQKDFPRLHLPEVLVVSIGNGDMGKLFADRNYRIKENEWPKEQKPTKELIQQLTTIFYDRYGKPSKIPARKTKNTN